VECQSGASGVGQRAAVEWGRGQQRSRARGSSGVGKGAEFGRGKERAAVQSGGERSKVGWGAAANLGRRQQRSLAGGRGGFRKGGEQGRMREQEQQRIRAEGRSGVGRGTWGRGE